MARGIFRFRSLETLQAWQTEIDNKLATDPISLTTSTSVGSASVGKTPHMPLGELIEEINWALEYKAPTTYAPLKRTSKSVFL